MNRLKDKRALITGGATGIGLETARQFLGEGARVAITGRNLATLEAAGKELGSEVLIIPSDASDVAAQKAVAETLRQAFGALDILLACRIPASTAPPRLPAFACPRLSGELISRRIRVKAAPASPACPKPTSKPFRSRSKAGFNAGPWR